MDADKLKQAVKQIKEGKKRNFSQSADLIINIKNLDLKKNENQVEFFISLPHARGKKSKVCALIGPELGEQSKVCDNAILQADFPKYAKDKKLSKKLANEYKWFIAQANIMPKIAQTFGRVFGPRGKMPNPKAGCIVPPNANLQPIYDKLQNTVKISIKKIPMAQLYIGSESSSDEDLIENIKAIYDNLIHHLPAGKNNIKSIYLKLTMGKPMRIM